MTPRTTESPGLALEEALRERVTRLVATRGVPAARVRAAVRQVVAALPARAGPDAREVTVLATFAATRPDLASALRAAGAARGVRVVRAGHGSAGRHTVVAALVAAADREQLPAIAAALGASLAVGEAPGA